MRSSLASTFFLLSVSALERGLRRTTIMTLTLIGMAIALGLAPTLAQTPAGLRPGAPVRATYRTDASPDSPTTEVSGVFAAVTAERLLLRTDSSRTHDVPVDRLVRVEIRERSAARGAGKGALYGTMAGAALGLIAAAGACTGDSYFAGTCGGEDYALVALVVGGMGAGAGAAIGALVGGERWREVPLD